MKLVINTIAMMIVMVIVTVIYDGNDSTLEARKKLMLCYQLLINVY